MVLKKIDLQVRKSLNPKSNSLAGISFTKNVEKNLQDTLYSLGVGSRKNLYFLYSDYFIRASRNPDFKNIFASQDNIYATDGKGVEWASFRLKDRFSQFLFNQTKKYPKFINFCLFILFLISNFFHGFYTLVFKVNTFFVTHNKVILGRKFKDKILDLAVKKQYKTLLIGSFDEEFEKKLARLYPRLDVSIWSMDSKSKFMQDKSSVESDDRYLGLAKISRTHKMLNTNNLLTHFPQFKSVLKLIGEQSFDIILVCCGGASGKQEFFMEYLKNKTSLKYTLCVGLGAAFDHLGGGQKQEKTPDFVQNSGLEWLYRLFTNPSRFHRIIDSVFGFYWLVSKYPFERSLD